MKRYQVKQMGGLKRNAAKWFVYDYHEFQMHSGFYRTRKEAQECADESNKEDAVAKKEKI